MDLPFFFLWKSVSNATVRPARKGAFPMNQTAAMKNVAVIILAAGKGTRMNSTKAKVLHRVGQKPMIQYVASQAVRLAGDNVLVVVGTQSEHVKLAVSEIHPNVGFVLQEQQLGTGHAVSCALPAVKADVGHVVILCGDVPFTKNATLTNLVNMHVSQNNIITVLGANIENPSGYGRLAMSGDGRVKAIVEEADATDAEKNITLINTGIYCVQRPALEEMLARVRPDNVQKEKYLTDIVGIAAKNGGKIGMMQCADSNEILGINTPADLAKAEAVISSNEKP